jgi:mono/diheme cytochrome c family protein
VLETLRRSVSHDIERGYRCSDIFDRRTCSKQGAGEGRFDDLKGAGCADCHGKFADGSPDDDDFPTGADLRTTKLDTTALKLTIRCGRAGTGMPSFDEGAYVIRGCYGRPLGARPDNLQPTPRNLTLEEIDDVIAYLQTRIIGRGKITREECLAYFDGQGDECEDYK